MSLKEKAIDMNGGGGRDNYFKVVPLDDVVLAVQELRHFGENMKRVYKTEATLSTVQRFLNKIDDVFGREKE